MIAQTTAKHTSGPWQVKDYYWISAADEKEIAKVWLRSDDDGNYCESVANAYLIASAPDMLSLLKRINEAFYVKGTRKVLMEVMNETKPLIARAEGR